jgi:hypothetical protein
MRTVPENIRTYAILSPAGPRSILNTVPETGPLRIACLCGQQLAERSQQGLDAEPRDRRAREHRVHQPAP